jgi:hypothetical protein
MLQHLYLVLPPLRVVDPQVNLFTDSEPDQQL